MHAGSLNQTNFNSTHVQEHTVPYFPFPIWQDESMHELLMQMARSVAEVIKEARDPAQPPGNLLRSLIRVDVALVQQQGLVSVRFICWLSNHVWCEQCADTAAGKLQCITSASKLSPYLCSHLVSNVLSVPILQHTEFSCWPVSACGFILARQYW